MRALEPMRSEYSVRRAHRRRSGPRGLRTHGRAYNASSGNSYDGEMCDSEKIKCGRSVRRRSERASGCKQGIFRCGSFIIIECAALMARLPAPHHGFLLRRAPLAIFIDRGDRCDWIRHTNGPYKKALFRESLSLTLF